MKTFTVSFNVTEARLSTVIAVITKEVTNLTVAEAAPSGGAKKDRKPRTISGRKSPAWEAAINFLNTKKPGDHFTVHQVSEVLVAAGCASSSGSPLCSRLVQAGLAAREKDGSLRVLKLAA